jgi:GntR family galactonate operon transcriptional repressor
MTVPPDSVRVGSAIKTVLAGRARLSPLANELGERIVSGELGPGAVLSERMFGPQRRVSRTSFREAIKVLEGKGLVRSRQNTGTQAAPRDEWNLLDPEVLAWRIRAGGVTTFIHDFFAFRRCVEPHAAEAAARRRNAELIAEIRRAFEQMLALESDDPFGSRYVDADMQFHKAVFTSSENEFFMAMGRILEVPMMLSFTLHSSLEVGPKNRLALHENVLLQIEAGNPGAACNSVLELLADVERDVDRMVEAPQAAHT